MEAMSGYGDNWGLIGHEWAVNLLAGRLATGHTSHAYLFTGPAQVGKTTLALRLAQALNCTGATPPCGGCRACWLIEERAHPDVLFVEAEGASLKIDAIRSLQGFLTLRPFEARYRIAIILRAQETTPSAADALLKTLEEPPPAARLFLTADAAGSLLPTIVSRCQVIPLRTVPVAQIEAALREQSGCPPEEAELLAHLSAGRPGWALSAAREPQILAQRAEIIEQMLTVLQANRTARFQYAEGLARTEGLENVLAVWQSWWRDAMLLSEGSHARLLNVDHLATLEQVASHSGPEEIRRAVRAIRETLKNITTTNVNTRLALEVMLLDMPYL